MKKIDFIIKNFQASSFIKDIQKGGEQWCEEEVAKNYKDYNDICSKLSYLKFFKGELKNIPFEDKNKKQIIKFFKKEKEINPQNIEKFFFKKGIYNLPNLDYIRDYGATGDYKFNELIKTYVFQGILFQKVKEFSLIYNGFISFKSSEALIENDQYSIICFYSKTDKKYHLLVLFLESDGNDSYQYLKSFKKKPSINEVKTLINKSSIPSFFDFWKKHSSIELYNSSKNIELDKYWSKQLKSALNLERKEEKIFKDEASFYKNCKNDKDIEFNFVTKEPEKYFKNQNPSFFLKRHWKNNPLQKVKKFKFFTYIMSEKFSYRHNPKFILEILHLPDDLEGLLSLVPKKIQESKILAEEIRILKMLRVKDKKFLVKVFNTNKDKLYDLALNYMPKKIFDDPFLVMRMIKIDTNIIDLIGKKLKKNKKFMKEVWK